MSNSHEGDLSSDEIKFIQDAARYLENPSFLMKLADYFGKPLELVLQGVNSRSHRVAGVEHMVVDSPLAVTVDARSFPTAQPKGDS